MMIDPAAMIGIAVMIGFHDSRVVQPVVDWQLEVVLSVQWFARALSVNLWMKILI